MNKKIEGEFQGVIEFTPNGNASIQIGEDNYFIYKTNTLNSLHLDVVKVEVFDREYRNETRAEAKVLEIVERNQTTFVGRLQKSKKATFVVTNNNKLPDFYIKGGLVADDNQMVIIEFTKWEGNSPQAKIIEIIGNSGENETEMNSIMIEYGLPLYFPLDAQEESELISGIITDEEILSRRDMRNISTLTIDPKSARDFDDAISVDIIDDDNIEIGIHIADVSHFIKEGSKIDIEAYNRATSVYLVDRCIPMLPERLSNDLCSLRPNEDRLAFSAIFNISKDGTIKKEWYGKTVINSNRKFSYEEAQEIIEGTPGEFQKEIRILDSLAKNLRKARMKEGGIEISGIEIKFKLAEDNKKPIGVYYTEQKDANKLIEEFMLLANRSVAKLLKSKLGFCVNRSHPEPNIDRINELKSICDRMGYEFNIADEGSIKQSINNLTKQIKDTPEENFMSSLIIRTQCKAFYTTKNIGHYGLSFKDYCHYTSPIRRYSDLIIHRLLETTLNK